MEKSLRVGCPDKAPLPNGLQTSSSVPESSNNGQHDCNGCSNPRARFKLYAGSGSYCFRTTPNKFQLKRTVCNNFRGIVPNCYSQVLLTSTSVFSTLLDRSTLVIPNPLSIEYRLLGLEVGEVIEKIYPVKDHHFA